MTELRRHDLVWLQKSTWQSIIQHQEVEVQELLSDWLKNSWPAVVCRDEKHFNKGKIAVGISLINSQNKKLRVLAFVNANEIIKQQHALSLQEAAIAAPLRWQEDLKNLMALPYRFSVFGSLSWQALTQKSYVSPMSDIDLLYRPIDQADLKSAIQVWRKFSKCLPLDGEIEFESGEAVSIREWQQSERVLCKSLNEVRLCSRKELVESLPKTL